MLNGAITRRALLFIGAALAAFPLWKYLTPASAGNNGIDITIKDLPENGVYMLRDKKAAIIRKNNEIRAISIACTHLGCTLNAVDDAFICPCHGSSFSLDGKVLKGPATIDLKDLRYELKNDIVRLYL